MWGLRFRAIAVGCVAALSMLAVPGSAWAGGPGTWTKLATIDQGSDTVGMLRTADGKLHLVWLAKANGSKHSFGTSTISLSGKLLATGTALSNWGSLEPDPQLVRDGSGMRLIFEGGTGSSGCFSVGLVYTETSTDGSHWSAPVTGSLSSHSAGIGNLAATTELNGTPVALFAGGHLFHVGVDANCPALNPDGTISQTLGSAPSNPALATDQSGGAVWAAWYQGFVKQGYWVDRILPSQSAPIEAPGSAATAQQNNQPLEPVAITARPGGGVYMAYCTATSTQQCGHIDLWKVGSSSVKVVPGSHNSRSTRLALAAGPQGRLSVVWYDATKSVIHAVRTNTSATAFGAVRTIKPPAKTFGFNAIQAEGSSGRLDVLIVDQLSTTSGFPIGIYHTQILAGLSLAAKPSKFSHKKGKKVTFTVTDAGQAIAGAKVSCLGKHATTAATGKVKLAFHKGAAKGKHVCTATKSGYNAGKTTIKVT
jgi:hypothetical protein